MSLSSSSLPEFALATWELPPDSNIPLVAPADRVFETFWDERRVEIWMREVVIDGGRCYFYRESNDSRAGNWVVFPPQIVDATEVGYWFQPLNGKPDSPDWPLQRLFHFEGARYGCPGIHQLICAPKYVSLQIEGRRVSWVTDLWEGIDFLQMKAAQIGRVFRTLLDEQSSDVRMALTWLHLPKSEQQEFVIRFQRSDLHEMRTLMRYVLWTQAGIWEDNKAKVWTYPCDSVYDFNKPPYWGTHVWIVGSDDASLWEGPFRLVRWHAVLEAYFEPSILEIVRGWVRGVDPGLERISVEVNAPSQHEILEAHTALSEWLRPKVSPKQFDQLMSDTDEEFIAQFNF